MVENQKHTENLPAVHVNLDTIEQDLEKILQENKEKIQHYLQQPVFTWETLMQPLETLGERLHQFWAMVSHLNSVKNSEALRNVYNRCLPKLSDYSTALSHNNALYQAVRSIAESPAYHTLTTAQQKVINNDLRDFRLSGVTLPLEQKAQYATLVKDLNLLTAQFEENLLDATHAWTRHITDEQLLKGIPALAQEAAKAAAKAKQLTGWLFTLEAPSYSAVVTYADSRTLREEFYRAYVTRASEIGPYAGKWNNSEVMHEILSKRLQLARLLDFKNYAEESLATKMVTSPKAVIDFLQQLADAALPKAKTEFNELSEFAKEALNIFPLQAWDVAYTSEKLRQAHYAISQETLRPYFPQPTVVQGLFKIVHKLFGVTITLLPDVAVWEPAVQCYELRDATGVVRSYFYLDLYARANKRGGAWMDDYCSRRRLSDGTVRLPVAFITCNFNGPINEQPALFTHDEVVTLFHEFGHALQHMLTTVDYLAVSGINGIPWDAVEVASQFLENWAWEKESLGYISQHYQTGEPLPDTLFEKLIAAKNFQAAMHMVRQLEFALFDFQLHIQFNPDEEQQIQKILNQVRAQVAVVPIPEFNRFQHGFSHIFAGGYAAGYYSYKWAEVMASDAFSLFQEKGIFDAETAQAFLQNILEPGGSIDPGELFKKFRGRPPRVDALLKQHGIL